MCLELKVGCKYYSKYLNINWTCAWCLLPFRYANLVLNSSLKAHVRVISETKMDESYPSQFSLPGYHIYRKDSKKGGGRLIAYFSTALASRKLALPKPYKTLKAITVKSKIGRNDVLFLSIYRPPKKKPGNEKNSCMGRIEEKMNDICQWASFQKQTTVILGDLNMNQLKPNYGGGKIFTKHIFNKCSWNVQEMWNLQTRNRWSLNYLWRAYGESSEAQDQGDYFQTDKEYRFWGAQQGPEWYSMAHRRYI